jgi:hypothetical protein
MTTRYIAKGAPRATRIKEKCEDEDKEVETVL